MLVSRQVSEICALSQHTRLQMALGCDNPISPSAPQVKFCEGTREFGGGDRGVEKSLSMGKLKLRELNAENCVN